MKDMIIAIPSQDKQLYPHFGRAPEFTFATIEGANIIEIKVLSNPGHAVGSIPKFINDQGAKVLIAGGVGPRAVEFLKEFGIDVILGVSGKINEIIKEYLNGTLEGGTSMFTPGSGKESGHGLEKIKDGHECEHGKDQY